MKAIRGGYCEVLAVLVVTALLGVMVGSCAAGTGDTTLVSVDSSGNQANDYSGLWLSMSSDGRYVAFQSSATNLVADDTNGATDVFVRDLQEETTERVSISDSGTQASGGESTQPSISSDGRIVAFTSEAANLVADDTNGVFDVFVRDLQERTTERVSISDSESQANFRSHGYPSISPDGRYVAFASQATNLVPNDTNGQEDVFVRDLQEGTTGQVSVNGCPTPAQANATSFFPSISPGGRYVAFDSWATNLVADDTNSRPDVFVRDLQEGTNQRANVGDSGTQANRGTQVRPSISSDGRRVAFESYATNLVADDTNNVGDVFMRDRQAEPDNPPSDCTAPTGSTASATTGDGASYTADTWTNRAVGVTFEAQDNEGGSGIRDIHYSATGAQSIPLTVYDHSDQVEIFADGTTTLSYFATDKMGNRESPAKSFTLKLDRTDPTATVAINGGDAYTHDTAVDLTLSGNDPSPGSGVAEMRFSNDGTTWSEWEPFATTEEKWELSEGDGQKTVYVQFKDAAGNQSATAQDTIVLDTAAPTTTHTVSPAPNAAGWNNSDVTVTLDATDTGESGVKEIDYSINGGANKTYNPTEKIVISSDGANKISYFATDNAGNQESPAKNFKVKLDRSAPKVTAATPTGSGTRRNTNLTATFSEKVEPTSVTKATFKLYRCVSINSTSCNTQVTNITVSLSIHGLRATLNPHGTSSTLLARKTKYKVTVTTGTKDKAGNALDQKPSAVGNQNKVWYFITGSR